MHMPDDDDERPRAFDVGLYDLPSEPLSICVFVKRTYDLVHGRRMTRSRGAELPLHLEFLGEDADGTEPIECPVTEWDFAPRKPCTDIIIHGHVRSPNARPITSTRAAVRVGEGWKHVLVIGDRQVRWRPGTLPSFSEPEPFVEIPLTWRRAYGGVDGSVDPRRRDDLLELLAALSPSEIPGAYPPNPVGVGWVVQTDRHRVDGLRLPNFETLGQPLAPDRLVFGRASRWPWAPEPAGFGWIGHAWFPRSTLMGLEPTFDSLPQHLRKDWLELPPEFVGGPDLRFYSGATSGMRRVALRGDEPVELHGFHHRGPVSTALPGDPPHVTINLRRRPLPIVTRLHTIELFPDRGLASLLWVFEARMPPILPLNLPGAGAEGFADDLLDDVDVLLDGVVMRRS